MKVIFSVVVGALLGVSATLLHILLFPLGLVLALVATIIGIWAVGRNLVRTDLLTTPHFHCS